MDDDKYKVFGAVSFRSPSVEASSYLTRDKMRWAKHRLEDKHYSYVVLAPNHRAFCAASRPCPDCSFIYATDIDTIRGVFFHKIELLDNWEENPLYTTDYINMLMEQFR